MSVRSALLDEINSMLTESNLFSHFPDTELNAAAHYFGIHKIARDKTLFVEGDPGNFMCIVHSGATAVRLLHRPCMAVGRLVNHVV
jgi:CRP/FNR family transcriptional regulator, cyclic AMP receptor protein